VLRIKCSFVEYKVFWSRIPSPVKKNDNNNLSRESFYEMKQTPVKILFKKNSKQGKNIAQNMLLLQIQIDIVNYKNRFGFIIFLPQTSVLQKRLLYNIALYTYRYFGYGSFT
jgi:hypothetical protein